MKKLRRRVLRAVPAQTSRGTPLMSAFANEISSQYAYGSEMCITKRQVSAGQTALRRSRRRSCRMLALSVDATSCGAGEALPAGRSHKEPKVAHHSHRSPLMGSCFARPLPYASLGSCWYLGMPALEIPAPPKAPKLDGTATRVSTRLNPAPQASLTRRGHGDPC